MKEALQEKLLTNDIPSPNGSNLPRKDNAMSTFRDELLARKNKLEQQLKPFYDLVKELNEVKKALAAIESNNCDGCILGCAICQRSGL